MSERIRQAEFARRCNVGRSTVNKWVKAGRIHLGEDGLLDAEESLKMRGVTESPLPHHQARKVQIEQERKEKARAVNDAGKGESQEASRSSESISLKLKFATMKEREAKADMAAMDRDKQAGRLVEIEKVNYVLQDFGHTLRGLMESLPDRLAHELAGYRGDINMIHAAIDGAARDLLGEISDHMKRKMKQTVDGE